MGFINFSRNLDTVGDGTGAINGALDYSATPTIFRIKNLGKAVSIYNLRVMVVSSSPMTQTAYGSIAALTRGITLKATINGAISDLLRGLAVKTNLDWVERAWTTNIYPLNNTSLPAATFDLNFSKVLPELLVLTTLGDELSLTLNDNFTGLVRHTFTAMGMIEV